MFDQHDREELIDSFDKAMAREKAAINAHERRTVCTTLVLTCVENNSHWEQVEKLGGMDCLLDMLLQEVDSYGLNGTMCGELLKKLLNNCR